jgi:formylglycine-generating enzyme required for sulfatase activity
MRLRLLLHVLPTLLRTFVGVAFLVSFAQAAEGDPDQPGLLESLGKLFKPAGAAEPAIASRPTEISAPNRSIVLPASEHRVALVIGNADYNSSRLANPVNDARAIAARLRQLNFQVLLRENLKAREIGGVYREFRSKISPGGTALVFYAGHGVQFKGQNYFPAIDSEISGEEDVPLQSLNLGLLLDNMEEAKAGVSLVFLDACRDNPFARRFRSGARGLAKVEAASGTLIHYATKPGSVADDGDGKNGTYTEALLAQISDPGVPVEQMLKRVTNRVVTKTKGKQEPWVEGSLRGDFYFIFQAPTTVNVQPPPSDPEDSLWAQLDPSRPCEYQAYLDQYPKGKYNALAKLRIKDCQPVNETKTEIPPPKAVVPPAPTLSKPVAVEDPETAFWNEVKANGAREYYEAYAKQYPKGKYLALAKLELKKLDDKDKADKAREDAERKVAQARDEAERKRMTELEKQERVKAEQELWESVKRENTVAAYVGYLSTYPSGSYTVLAQLAKEKVQREDADKLRQEAIRKDQEAKAVAEREKQDAARRDQERVGTAQREEAEHWQRASAATDSATVQSYLDRYPNGRYLADAKAKLDAVKKQEAELRPGKVFKDCAECPEMVVIPAGSFVMGGTENLVEKPLHNVQIAKSFALAKTEVTQGQWKALMGNNPSVFKDCGDDCPVDQVSWDDAQEFVRKLSQKTGATYRLPSEAEWEYACRAGGAETYCGSNDVDSVGWYSKNSGAKVHKVAKKQPNAWGLHDMTGNVQEWMQDCWNFNYNGAPTDGGARSSGECAQRVLRSGNWRSFSLNVRAADRSGNNTSVRSFDLGFRPARILPVGDYVERNSASVREKQAVAAEYSPSTDARNENKSTVDEQLRRYLKAQ